MIKYPDKGNLEKEESTLAHRTRVLPIMVAKSRQQQLLKQLGFASEGRRRVGEA